MKLIGKIFVAAVLMISASAFGITVVSNDKVSFDIGGLVQAQGTLEYTGTSNGTDPRPFLFLGKTRLLLGGTFFDSWKWEFNNAFGGESSTTAKASGAVVYINMVDAYLDIPFIHREEGRLALRFGQFKVPYGRENLVDDTRIPFAQQSINGIGFGLDRQLGLLLNGRLGFFRYGIGTFAGGGRDTPTEYVPIWLGVPMLSARLGLDTGVDEDISRMKAYFEKPESVAFAAFANAVYEADTQVGHSTIISQLSGASIHPLILDKLWNPLAGVAQLGNQWLQVGGDLALKIPAGEGALTLEAEGHYASFSPTNNSLLGVNGSRTNQLVASTNNWMWGGKIQATYATKKIDIGLRFAMLGLPANSFGVLTGTNAASTTASNFAANFAVSPQPIIELTPSFSFKPTDFFKVVIDMALMLQTIVEDDNSTGSHGGINGRYVILPDMPGQIQTVSGMKASGIAYAFVPELRVMLQLNF